MKLDVFKRTRPEPLKGVSAGLVGGMLGSLAMSAFQRTLSEVKAEMKEREERHYRAQYGQLPSESHLRSESHPASRFRSTSDDGGESASDEEESTVKTAEFISEKIFRHPLSEHEKELAGPAVHYTYGSLIGGAYGVTAEYLPEITYAHGSIFGAGLMVASDEIAVPALRLSKPPHRYPPSTHIYALISHVIYGLTTELTRRSVRRLMD